MTPGTVLVGTTLPKGGWRFVPPAPRVITLPEPPAGQGWTWKAPADALLALRLLRTKLVAGATGETRSPAWAVYAPTGTPLWAIRPVNIVIPTETKLFIGTTFSIPITAPTDGIVVGIPFVTLPPNCTVSFTVGTQGATDQVSTIVILAELI